MNSTRIMVRMIILYLSVGVDLWGRLQGCELQSFMGNVANTVCLVRYSIKHCILALT